MHCIFACIHDKKTPFPLLEVQRVDTSHILNRSDQVQYTVVFSPVDCCENEIWLNSYGILSIEKMYTSNNKI